MASNIKANGTDLDSIFKARGTSTARANVGWKVNNVDIADRYYASTYPTNNDRIANNTGLQSGGADLKTMFRDINYVLGPTITLQPTNLVLAYGATATFTVAATGVGTLYYQWRWNGVDVGGATSATYSFSNVDEADEGNYE